MKQFFILIFTIISLLNISLPSFAKTQGVFTNTGIGGRSSVFGESFVAIADDASAIHWNPAGISKLANRYNATASRINLFSGFTGISDINYNFLSFVFSNHLWNRGIRRWGGGISLDWLSTNKIIESDRIGNIKSLESGYAEYKGSASISGQLWKLGSVGISGNYFRIQTEIPSNDLGITLGYLSDKWIVMSDEKYECWLRFGATARNAFDTIDSPTHRYTFASTLGGGFENWGMLNIATAYSRGVSKNSSKWTLSAEYGGNEWKSLYGVDFNIYGGFEYYPSTSVKFLKAGGGIGRGSWLLNYSFERHPFLENTHRVALNLRWSKNETIISMKKSPEGEETDKFETTDDIIIHIDVSDDVQIESIEEAQPKLIFSERAEAKQPGKKLEKSYQDIIKEKDQNIEVKGQEHILNYTLKPTKYQFYPATYIVSVYARGRKLQSAEFSLSYNQRVEQLVGEAYNSLVQGNLEKAKSYLLDAANAEQNYPNIYYIAGLISEVHRDFIGAQKCYSKASKLSGEREIYHMETKINPKKFAESDYLKKYAESQKRQGRPGIGLYEELEGVVKEGDRN